jgi:hypothetical protein
MQEIHLNYPAQKIYKDFQVLRKMNFSDIKTIIAEENTLFTDGFLKFFSSEHISFRI